MDKSAFGIWWLVSGRSILQTLNDGLKKNILTDLWYKTVTSYKTLTYNIVEYSLRGGGGGAFCFIYWNQKKLHLSLYQKKKKENTITLLCN